MIERAQIEVQNNTTLRLVIRVFGDNQQRFEEWGSTCDGSGGGGLKSNRGQQSRNVLNGRERGKERELCHLTSHCFILHRTDAILL